MKKILIVHNSIKTVYSFRRSNIESYILGGYSVSVLAPDYCEESVEKLRKLGVVCICRKLWFDGVITFSLYLNYKIILHRLFNRDSVYICHFVSTFVMTFLTLCPFNRKLIVYIEGLGSVFYSNKVYLFFLRLLLNVFSNKLLVCNSSERNVLGRGVVTHGIGVDLAEFDVSQAANEGVFNLVYIGRLLADKGVYDALEVLRILKGKKIDVKLTLIGDIYLKNPSSLKRVDIESLEAEFGNDVCFKGYDNNLAASLASYNMLILPSKLEGFSVCIMEASACGVPSVCYDVPGCRDAVKHGVNGFLVPYRRVEQMASEIEGFIGRGEFDSVACREYAEKKFDAKLKSKELMEHIAELHDVGCV